jgi:hypothetical protein
MSAQTLLSGGDKWYSYSGVLSGDVSVPATIQMLFIPNTGLRDSYIDVEPYFGRLISGSTGEALGVEIKLDDVTVVKSQQYYNENYSDTMQKWHLFIPRQSKLEILSLNTTANNTQERGVNLIGYYL